MSLIKNFYTAEPASGQAPKSMVILCHGLGSNGQDLISLAPYLAQGLPDTIFISPDAPFACDMVPPGYPDSYQWFSLQSREPEVVLEGIQIAAPVLEDFITQQSETYELPFDRIILSGFSQGSMMSLYVGLNLSKKLGGILGYSGALALDPEKEFQNYQQLPICLVHGEADDVVPFSSYRYARKTLLSNDYDVEGHSTPGLGHSIDEQGLQAGLDFIKNSLS